MEDNRIKESAKLLLDLGKRNTLLNFKDTKKTSAEIVAPDVEMIFKKAQGESSLEVFDPKIMFDELDEIMIDDKINRSKYIDMYSKEIKPDKQACVHLGIGKMSFKDEQLLDNLKEFVVW